MDDAGKIISLSEVRMRRDAQKAAQAALPTVLPELCGFSLREFDVLNRVYQQGLESGLFTHRRIHNRDGLPHFDMCHDSKVNWPVLRVVMAPLDTVPTYLCLASRGFVMDAFFEDADLARVEDALVRQVAMKSGAIKPTPSPNGPAPL